MSANTALFIKLIEDVQSKGSIQEAIGKAESLYCLKPYRISEISASEAVKLYESIYLKFYKGHSQTSTRNWYQNQLRIFVWFLACYIYLEQRHIQDLTKEDWKYFQTIFDKKDPKLFEYQSQAILATAKGKIWEKNQQQILKKIVEQKEKKAKWNEVSKQLFQLSGKKYFRTAKQCRQKWNNHLDPFKIKGYWKAEECLTMFQFVQQHGKKWAALVKILHDTRNQHSVKNKFNSIIKKHRKLYKFQNEQDMYEQIIHRIRKSINSKQIYDSADFSFDIQEHYNELDSEKQQILQSCHPITQNFIKLLERFNTDDFIPTKFTMKKKQHYSSLICNENKNKIFFSDSQLRNSWYSRKIPSNTSFSVQYDYNCLSNEYDQMQKRMEYFSQFGIKSKNSFAEKITGNDYNSIGKIYDSEISLDEKFAHSQHFLLNNNHFYI